MFDLAATSAFPDDLRDRMVERLGADVLTVAVSDSRSQFRNRMLARARLRDRLEEAMKRPPTRRETKPTRASKRRRLKAKRSRGEIKRLRRPPPQE